MGVAESAAQQVDAIYFGRFDHRDTHMLHKSIFSEKKQEAGDRESGPVRL